MLHISHSLEETSRLAALFVSQLSQNPSQVFGFSGDLGSGKTAFTQAVATELGITEHVTSPTFVIQKRYAITKDDFPFKTLIHIDAYRLESAKELEVLGFKRELEDPDNLILIEWPERVQGALPHDTPKLVFTFISEDVRSIQFPDMMGL
jgi:tRNA threonylcarbamoyladenosine biosynthesis protein TsaE